MFLSTSLLDSKELIGRPALSDKISCPICCVAFHGMCRPMICCENRHTICMKCIDGIVQKSIMTPQTQCLCPICRQRIQMPLQSAEQMREFVDLIRTLNRMYESYDTLQLKSYRLDMVERNLRETKQQLTEAKRKLQASDCLVQMLRVQNSDLKSKLEKAMSFNNGHSKENVFMIQSGGTQKDKKLPLSVFIDDMTNQKHLNLAKKQFSVKHVQYLIMYDMSQLLEVNLSFNNLGDEGVYILLREHFMPQLLALKLSNNQITRLPPLKHVSNLEELDLCNFYENKHPNANRIKEASIEVLMQQKWQKLKNFGIEFENDKVWEDEKFLDEFIERFPSVTKLELSNCKTKIPKTRCQRIKNTLNEKGKRTCNNKFMVVARSY